MKYLFAVPLILVVAPILLVSPAFSGEGDRLQRALDWPKVDLSQYEAVFIEDVRVTDPKAEERKIQDLVQTVPGRMANFIAFSVDQDQFPEVERRSPEAGEDGLIVRVELPQYKPGSAAARTMLIGTGSAHLNVHVTLLDAGTGDELASFTEDRTFAWGGLYGGTRGITLMEENAAKEIAAWLSLGKGQDPDAILAKMKNVALSGPPETEHGTIYILRPQAMVGAAVRFRVGIDDLTLGESKRKRYYVVYAPPGDYRVWAGGDKKKRYRPIKLEAGGVYYFMAMGMKQMPEKKGANKLKECKLAREVDLTRFRQGD
jgi:hypothetical protein